MYNITYDKKYRSHTMLWARTKEKIVTLCNFAIFFYYIFDISSKVTMVQTNVSLEPSGLLGNFSLMICRRLVKIYRDDDYGVNCTALTDDACLEAIYSLNSFEIIQNIKIDQQLENFVENQNSFDMNQSKHYLFDSLFCVRLEFKPGHVSAKFGYLHEDFVIFFLHQENLPFRDPSILNAKLEMSWNTVFKNLKNYQTKIIFSFFRFTRLEFPYSTSCKNFQKTNCLVLCTKRFRQTDDLPVEETESHYIIKQASNSEFDDQCSKECSLLPCHDYQIFVSHLETVFKNAFQNNLYAEMSQYNFHFTSVPIISSLMLAVYIVSLASSFYALSFISFSKQVFEHRWFISLCVPSKYKLIAIKLKRTIILLLSVSLFYIHVYKDAKDFFTKQMKTETLLFFPYNPAMFSISFCFYRNGPYRNVDKIICKQKHGIQECKPISMQLIEFEHFKLSPKEIEYRIHSIKGQKSHLYYHKMHVCAKFDTNVSDPINFLFANVKVGSMALGESSIVMRYFMHSRQDFARIFSSMFYEGSFNFIVKKEVRQKYPYSTDCIDYPSERNQASKADCTEQCLLNKYRQTFGNDTFPSSLTYTNLMDMPNGTFIHSFDFNESDIEECISNDCRHPDCVEFTFYPRNIMSYGRQINVGKC